MMNKTVALISLVAIIGFVLAAIFFGRSNSLVTQTQELSSELKTVSESLDDAEKDLIYYRNTDLAKEVQLLQLKLANAERDLATAQKEIANLQTKINNLETSISKTYLHLDAVAAMEGFLGGPFTVSGLANIDAKISLLGDSQVMSQWLKAKETIDISRNSWSPQDFFDTVFLLNSRIRSLLR